MERTLYGCVSVELTLEVEARAEVALRGRAEMVILSHPPGCGRSLMCLIKRAGRPSSGEAELKQRHPFIQGCPKTQQCGKSVTEDITSIRFRDPADRS